MGSPEGVYHSVEAVERFWNLEREIRLRQLGNLPFAAVGNSPDTFRGLSAVDDMVMSPLFGAWLDRVSQAVYNPAGDPTEAKRILMHRIDYIGNYAVAAALAGGQDMETYVRLAKEHIMIPEFGRAALNGVSGSWVRAEVADRGIMLILGKDTVSIHGDELHNPTDRWEPLRYIGPEDCKVPFNDIDPNRQIFRYPAASRQSNEAYAQWQTVFTDALHFLDDTDPYTAGIVRAGLRGIVPAPGEPLTHGKCMAAAAAFGVLGINENRDPIRLATHLVFGMRKHMIMALRGKRPDMYRSDDDPIAAQPVYPPSREGYGIAHHLLDDGFLNVGIARYFERLAGAADPLLRVYGELSFTRWYSESRQNLDALHASGYVYDGNREVVALLEAEMADLAACFERVPDAVKQTVAMHAHDRRISWRLHTVLPDRGAIARLRASWLSGAGCPGDIVPGSLSQSIEAYTHIGQRNRYVLSEVRIKEPDVFDTVAAGSYDTELFAVPTPGDIAFASGHIRKARAYFDAAIRHNPADIEAWAGFALTFTGETSAAARVLAGRPELAAAAYAAIGDTTAAPDTIAAWLEPSKMAELFLDIP